MLISDIPVLMHIHVHALMHTHRHTQTYTNMYTLSQTHTDIHKHVYILTHTKEKKDLQKNIVSITVLMNLITRIIWNKFLKDTNY